MSPETLIPGTPVTLWRFRTTANPHDVRDWPPRRVEEKAAATIDRVSTLNPESPMVFLKLEAGGHTIAYPDELSPR